MPVDTVTISPAQVATLLATTEGHYADLKGLDIKPSKLTKAIAAFANADGGELFVGIDEDVATKVRTWRGFADVEAANAHMQVFEGLFPLGRDFSYEFFQCPQFPGLVLHLLIMKTRDIKHATDEIVYIRRGAQSLPVTTPHAMKQLEYAKGLASFESEPVAVAPEVITNSLPVIEFMLHVVPNAEPLAWLTKQQMIANSKPTVAGVVLFAEEPQAVLPKRCGIKIYRYRTTDTQGTRDTLAFDPLTVEGHAYAQISAAVATTTRIVQEVRRLGDETLEEFQYPQETLHEIITNAVLHRDYSVADDIHIRIFDNRIEVQSPGRLPAHITVRNILDERFARNGGLVRIINKFPNPPNKDVGEGLNTAFDAMTKLGLKTPIIEERDNCLMVSIRHEPLASPETLILQYLEDHDSIRNRVAREICHIGADYIVKDIFGRLVARGLIEKVPGTDRATTAYRRGGNYASWRQENSPS